MLRIRVAFPPAPAQVVVADAVRMLGVGESAAEELEEGEEEVSSFFFFIPLYSSSPLLLLGFVLLVSVSVRADRGAGNVPRSHPP